jgi:hypothetical protein
MFLYFDLYMCSTLHSALCGKATSQMDLLVRRLLLPLLPLPMQAIVLPTSLPSNASTVAAAAVAAAACYPVNQPSAGERRAKSAKTSSSTSARSSSGANRGSSSSSSSSSRRYSKAAAAAVAPGAATVDDAVSYLDDVKQTYADAPDIHAEFIRILQVSNCFQQANYQSIVTQCQPLCLTGFVTGFSSQSAVHFKL